MRVNSIAGRVLAISLCSTALVAFAMVVPARAQVAATESPGLTRGTRPYTIVTGPDGDVWFTESLGNEIDRLTPTGAITAYAVPTAADPTTTPIE